MVNVQTNPIKEKEITNIIELNKVIENTIKLINQGSSTIDFEEKVEFVLSKFINLIGGKCPEESHPSIKKDLK